MLSFYTIYFLIGFLMFVGSILVLIDARSKGREDLGVSQSRIQDALDAARESYWSMAFLMIFAWWLVIILFVLSELNSNNDE